MRKEERGEEAQNSLELPWVSDFWFVKNLVDDVDGFKPFFSSNSWDDVF